MIKFPILCFSLKECELNLANLYKSEVEFDEDYTIPPNNLGKIISLFTFPSISNHVFSTEAFK